MIFPSWSLAVAVALAPAQADTLHLREAIALAREANPMLRAVRLSAEAAAERIGPAGALPDPRLDLGLMNRMISDLGSTMDPMTMNQIQASQMLPWPGKRGFARDRAERLAVAAGFDADEAERMLVARVQEVYYEMAYLDRAVTIMQGTRDLLRDLLTVAQTMYAVGEALQQDVLQAQVAVARMTEDITLMQAERVAMAARFNALVDRPATVVIGALELPAGTAPVPSADSLMQLARYNRPALAAASSRTQAAEAAVRLADRDRFPDVMVGVQYAARPSYDNMGSLMLGFSIPVWAGRKQEAMRREARAMEAMARADSSALASETFARLAEAVAMAERSRTLADLYAGSILPQARAAVEGSLAAYRVGRVDFMSVVENQMTVNQYETERVRLLASYHTARAEIQALTEAAGDSP